MYIDISLKKTLPLLALGIVLAILLVATFSAKDARFGTTPFYSAVSLGWQQLLGYTLYPFERAAKDLYAGMFGMRTGYADKTGLAAGIPVITYHRLVDDPDGANITFDNFKDQMETLRAAGWDTITLAEYEAYMRGDITLPEKSFLLTFDDGAKQSYYPVDPILKNLGFNAVNYIIVGDSLRDETTYYLSPQEIKNMLATGRWEIGSHSYAGHTPYAVDAAGSEGHFFSDKIWLSAENRIEDDEEFRARIAKDLAGSKYALEETYGTEIHGFAFPFGDTGETSANYPESHSVVIEEAERVYDYAWVQPGVGEFTYNYPHAASFLMRRIRVGPDWNGQRLVEELNRGLGKPIPYEDTLTTDNGWHRTWGTVQFVPDALLFQANPQASGASAFLDGTGAWENYEATFTGDWSRGYVIAMADLKDAQHYRACAFHTGEVSVQSISGDSRETLAKFDAPSVTHGHGVQIGIRTKDGVVQCLFGGRVVAEARGITPTQGGIGLQVWNESPDNAEFAATSLSVRDISGERLTVLPAAIRDDARSASPSVPNTGSRAVSDSEQRSEAHTPATVTTGSVIPLQDAPTNAGASSSQNPNDRDNAEPQLSERQRTRSDIQAWLDDIMKQRRELLEKREKSQSREKNR